MNMSQIQIERELFVDICRFFDLTNEENKPSKEELENAIKDGLQTKIKAINKRYAYSDVLKAKGTSAYNDKLLNYLEMK